MSIAKFHYCLLHHNQQDVLQNIVRQSINFSRTRIKLTLVELVSANAEKHLENIMEDFHVSTKIYRKH